MKRKVYKLRFAGSINNLKLRTEELADPAPDEVTVEVKSIGLNYADVFCVLGLYEAAPKTNLIPGLEFSGIVIKKGSNVNEFNIGDRVYGATKFGGYVTHINIKDFYLMKLPDNWTFEEGASFIVQSLTAYYALVILGELNSSKTVLIHSGAGGVGIYANRIAKKFNAYTIGTVGKEYKLEMLRREGYDKGIVRSRRLKVDIKNALGSRSLDLVLDTVGGKVFKKCFNMLAPMGRIICYGGGAFSTGNYTSNILQLGYNYLTRPKVDPLKMIEQNRAVIAFNLIWLYENGEYLKKLLWEIIKLDLPKPLIGQSYIFDELPEALRHFKSGKTMGKVVILVD